MEQVTDPSDLLPRCRHSAQPAEMRKSGAWSFSLSLGTILTPDHRRVPQILAERDIANKRARALWKAGI